MSDETRIPPAPADREVDPAECRRLAEEADRMQRAVDRVQAEQGREAYTCEAVVALGHAARRALPALARRVLWLEAALRRALAWAEEDDAGARDHGVLEPDRVGRLTGVLRDALGRRGGDERP